MNSVGMFPIGFDFAPTIGNLYGRFGAPDGTTIDLSPVNPVIHGTGCFGSNVPMRYFRDRGWASNGAEVPNLPKGDVWNLQVPEQVIDYPITVSTSAAQAPTPPGIIRGACTVGTPYSISFTSTDPNGRQLKYGIDWDNDGTVDQWVPPSAYVDLGTSQSASRTYAIAGAKTVKVLAQNDQGASSEWTTYSFNCSNINCPIGYVMQGGACDGNCRCQRH